MVTVNRYPVWLLCALAANSAIPAAESNVVLDDPSTVATPVVPGWTAQAVWYQVLVSRFDNGERANDPPGVLAWTEDWGVLLSGETPPLRTRLFYRQYGGDLQGLRSRLDHIASLGVNTLYLNPIFAAPSHHKYDTADLRHIDETYSLAADRDELARESADPATWVWTVGDRLFLNLLAEAHDRGLRVVLDGVFNHVGTEFWAWKDVVAKGKASAYAEWFDVTDWGPPLRYQAWDGPNGRLPRFRHTADGLAPDVEAHLFAVVRRWMDPDGDGDPRDGIDGWRLDAAEQVGHGFWRRFRAQVKAINQQAVIVGEIWIDAEDWLAGDQFDVVTNYRFSQPLISALAAGDSPRPATSLADELIGLYEQYPKHVSLGMVNLLGSHDTERAVTMLLDPRRHPPADDGSVAPRDLLVPGAEDFERLRLAALLQYTWAGAPMLYYGDEVGMAGGDDPFCRAPMRWDLTTSGGRSGELLRYYRELGRLRATREELRAGDCRVRLADDSRGVLIFERTLGREKTVVATNLGDTVQQVRIPGCDTIMVAGAPTTISSELITFIIDKDNLTKGLRSQSSQPLKLAPRSGVIIMAPEAEVRGDPPRDPG